MSRDVPQPWADRMERAGLTDPRNGRPSMSRLAEAADTHASTVSAMMYGTRQTSQEVIDRVAKALFPDAADFPRARRRVREWVGQALEDGQPFKAHPDADLLTTKEREAVNELIRLLAASKKRQSETMGQVIEGPFDAALEALPPESEDPQPLPGRSTQKAARKRDKK